jgi:hypothetical protein
MMLDQPHNVSTAGRNRGLLANHLVAAVQVEDQELVSGEQVFGVLVDGSFQGRHLLRLEIPSRQTEFRIASFDWPAGGAFRTPRGRLRLLTAPGHQGNGYQAGGKNSSVGAR